MRGCCFGKCNCTICKNRRSKEHKKSFGSTWNQCNSGMYDRSTGGQAADACDDGLIICGYQYPDMLFSELAANIPDYFDMLVIASRVHYEACRESGITCLPMPLRTQDFINTVSLTVENILWERKKRKTKPKERTEEEKKVIKAAKLKLMDDNGFDEQGAHRYLQKKSMDNGINIVEMAYMILEHTALF